MTVQEILRAIVDLAGVYDVESVDEIRRMIQQLEEPAPKTLTFESTDDAGSPRVFAGMWRPPSTRDPWVRENATAIYEHHIRDAWQRGDYDRPLYVLVEP